MKVDLTSIFLRHVDYAHHGNPTLAMLHYMLLHAVSCHLTVFLSIIIVCLSRIIHEWKGLELKILLCLWTYVMMHWCTESLVHWCTDALVYYVLSQLTVSRVMPCGPTLSCFSSGWCCCFSLSHQFCVLLG